MQRELQWTSWYSYLHAQTQLFLWDGFLKQEELGQRARAFNNYSYGSVIFQKVSINELFFVITERVQYFRLQNLTVENYIVILICTCAQSRLSFHAYTSKLCLLGMSFVLYMSFVDFFNVVCSFPCAHNTYAANIFTLCCCSIKTSFLFL